MISKLGVLSLFILIAGALNFSAIQDWNVPVIGIERAEAAVADCIADAVICCDRTGSGNCDSYLDWLGDFHNIKLVVKNSKIPLCVDY